MPPPLKPAELPGNGMCEEERKCLNMQKTPPFPPPAPGTRSSGRSPHTPTRGTIRSPAQQEEAYEQAVRQRWRALALVVKAKLEAVEAGISIFEREFFSDIVLPDGRTVGEYVLPQVEESYRSGLMPPLLPAIGGGEVDR